jgi:hypothetical protein
MDRESKRYLFVYVVAVVLLNSTAIVLGLYKHAWGLFAMTWVLQGSILGIAFVWWLSGRVFRS